MNLERHPRVLVCLVIIFVALTIMFGGLWKQELAKVAAYQIESQCNRLLKTLDSRFSKVNVVVSSHPRANILGEVATQADRDFLNQRVTEELGPARRATIGFSVRLKDP